MKKKVLIVGAGLVGSLCAVFMAGRGYAVRVVEKRPDPRKQKVEGNRSINLVISHRGWRALERVGLKQQIEKITVPVGGRMTHDVAGNQKFIPYSVRGDEIHSVSRSLLNQALVNEAEQLAAVQFDFGWTCSQLLADEGKVHFESSAGDGQLEVTADLIIGADGAYSMIRQQLEEIHGHQVELTKIGHGYKELLIPADEAGNYRLDRHALHIWPRKSFMLMALANLEGSFTCTLFSPNQGAHSFEAIQDEGDLLSFFQTHFHDTIPLMPSLKEDFFANPSSSLTVVKTDPWVYKDKVALIGDAAHAIVPFYGEGMNCGFEDCYVLNELLDQCGDNLGEALPLYGQKRKPNGDAIAALSMRNFIEMRDSVADERFLLRKKIEGRLYERYPDKWVPLYSQVKFSNIPYSEALKTGEQHDRIMEEVMAASDIEQRWESPELEEKALALLADRPS